MEPITFPLIIEDESQLSRFVYAISKDTAKRTAREVLMQTGQIKPMMTKAECYRLASRRKIDTAIKTLRLKFVLKGTNIWIKREDFENWLQKDSWSVQNESGKDSPKGTNDPDQKHHPTARE